MKKDFLYKKPRILSWDGWRDWDNQTKKDYPIQYFFREEVLSFCRCQWRRLQDLKYKIKCFFFPKHQEIRKAVPRVWADISSLVVDVNFAMILSFKKEADESCVDWQRGENIQKFKNWLDSSAHWITVGRPNCEAQRDALYPPYPLPEEMKNFTYEQLYGELNKIEKLISDSDTAILKQMIEYREYMWT
jgi:hypothetical protein